MGSLESTQEARVSLGCHSRNSYASFVLSKLHNTIHAKQKPSLKYYGWLSERSSDEVRRLYKSVYSLGCVQLSDKYNDGIFKK